MYYLRYWYKVWKKAETILFYKFNKWGLKLEEIQEKVYEEHHQVKKCYI